MKTTRAEKLNLNFNECSLRFLISSSDVVDIADAVMNKNTSTPSSEEVVIDLAPLDVSPSVDEIDGRRRTTNIAHIYHTKKSMAEGS